MKQNTVSDRLVARIRAQIRSGGLKAGEKLPSARQLVQSEGIALATAAKVIERLKRERLVRVVPGVGTVVCGDERGPELSLSRIVEAAISIADDEGLAALSMRAVASEVGVPTMSIYRHVPSKDELVVAMIDAAMKESKPPAKSRATWRAKLEAIARQQWAGYVRHPWLAQALSMTRPQATPAGMAHTDFILEVIGEIGFEPEVVLRTALSFIAFVRGMAINLEPEREAERDTGLSSEEWMEANEPDVTEMLAKFPSLMRFVAGQDIDISLERLFETGLACFLDGMEAQSRMTTTRGGPHSVGRSSPSSIKT